MAKAPGIFNKPDSGWRVFAVLLIVSCLTVTIWFREGDSGPLHAARGAFGVITAPLVRAGNVVGTPFRNLTSGESQQMISADEAQQLRDQNRELSTQVMKLEEYRQENERLTALLGLREAYDLDSIAARIVGRTSDSYNQTVVIDKGADAGLSKNMAVMNADGLLGKIESVTGSQSTIRLIFDPQSSVSVMIQSSRVAGLLKGSADGLLYLDYISTSQEVNVGDVVITSGEGGVYPKGIIVGEVISVNDRSSASYHTIAVKPISSSRTYEEVLVLTGTQKEVSNSDPTASAITEEYKTNSDSSSSSSEDAENGDSPDEDTQDYDSSYDDVDGSQDYDSSYDGSGDTDASDDNSDYDTGYDDYSEDETNGQDGE